MQSDLCEIVDWLVEESFRGKAEGSEREDYETAGGPRPNSSSKKGV